MEIKKISNVKYEIEKESRSGMNCGVTIYANEGILEKMRTDQTLKQAVNTTTLPGIVGNVVLMPDMHEGYGFPVGGVVAFDADEGIVSPGICGYDINCLHPDTLIMDRYGATHRIADIENRNLILKTLDLESKETIDSKPILFMKRLQKDLIKINTRLGKRAVVSGDHPVLTERGMIKAEALTYSDRIVINGFEGLEYKQPEHSLIISERELFLSMERIGISRAGNGKSQVLGMLKRLGLERLYLDSEKLPLLIKLMGHVFGDGTIPKTEKSLNGDSTFVSFCGKKEDLESILKDINELGFKGTTCFRQRHHKINTRYGTSEFDYGECSLRVSSRSFAVLLVALGAPLGKKTASAYRIPVWLMNSEAWQKRLFMAAFFGAEMSKPHAANGYNFHCPAFSVSKLETLKENAIDIVTDFRKLLSSLDIETAEPAAVEGYSYDGIEGRSIGIRLMVLSNTANLIRFFGSVGYLYNKEKERLANFACLYLRYLESARTTLDTARKVAIALHNSGSSTEAIVSQLSGGIVSESFVRHSEQGRVGTARIWKNADKFEDFVNGVSVGSGGSVYDEISGIERTPHNGYVYDLTLNDKNHNFIANGVVVSNCGIRVIKTNLTEKELKPKIQHLADALFRNVPSGVGSRLNIGLGSADLKHVSEEGIEYIIKKGFGSGEDIENCEENGQMVGADFSQVSNMAKSRGLHELGTLGAGNHFLEVQKIENIFDETIAKVFGLQEGQIVVMVHTGSRGFGHQICSDYLRTLVDYRREHNITLVDNELSYANIGSKEADSYLQAMKCAVNFAFTNREIITNSIRKSFETAFGKSSEVLGMGLLYDVAHNIVKLEEHVVNGERKRLYVHRKGATRAFSRGRDEVPKKYRAIGQPVLIPGSMSTASYILCGAEGSMLESFGSSCHGSGRVMSRHQAIREIPASKTFDTLAKKSVEIRIRTRKLVSEEAEWAYKNVDDVVGVVEKAGISKIVSKNLPIIVIKG